MNLKGLIVWGTSSNAGKSYVATGLGRALAKRGWNVAPFKGQNMSSNTYQTADGGEIGISQAIQAEACHVIPTVHMNPVLLKPLGERQSEVFIQGKSQGVFTAEAYHNDYYETAIKAVKESLTVLAKKYDLLVMEGAGSPTEMNLMDKDIANLASAELAEADAILVADIERGGIFASIVGTLSLLPPNHRKRVKGIVVNRFRGEPRLFESGVHWLEQYTKIPVIGVLPYFHIPLEQEDSIADGSQPTSSKDREQRLNQLGNAMLNYLDIDLLLQSLEIEKYAK